MSNTFSSFSLKAVFTTLAIGGCALLAGCASNEITEHRIDQPLPFASVAVTNPPMPPCLGMSSDVRRPHRLQPGSSCWFVVQSAVHFEESGMGTGLMLESKDVYTISIPEAASRTWYDKDRKTPAPRGDTGGFITQWLGHMKKHEGENWFALMATASESKNPRHVPDGSRLSCMAGELSFYVNDAHRFYGNNFGNLLLVIKREGDAASEVPCK